VAQEEVAVAVVQEEEEALEEGQAMVAPAQARRGVAGRPAGGRALAAVAVAPVVALATPTRRRPTTSAA
jgi:hypothetical protein